MSDRLRIGFAGTPPFAATALAAILDAGFEVAFALTRPDRPRGRGLRLSPSPVKVLAGERGVAVFEPRGLSDGGLPTDTPLDALVVAAYGLLLPQALLDWPRHGAINIHASLLPRWRGAAPIQRALLAGDAETGISIMQMDAGLDTGPIIARVPVPIAPRETAGTLTAKLAVVGAQAIVETLSAIRANRALSLEAQAVQGATYARKLEAGEAEICWTDDAQSIDRQVRAFDPEPGAFARIGAQTVKIRSAEAHRGSFDAPGTVLQADAAGLIVACGRGALSIRELQRPGGRRLPAAAFLAGAPIAVGSTVGSAEP